MHFTGRRFGPWLPSRRPADVSARSIAVRWMGSFGGSEDLPKQTSAASGIARLIRKLFRRDQFGGFETLRKAVVDWLKADDGIGGSTLTDLVVAAGRMSRLEGGGDTQPRRGGVAWHAAGDGATGDHSRSCSTGGGARPHVVDDCRLDRRSHLRGDGSGISR